MYLNWKWLALFCLINLVSGIASAAADHPWRALINGAGFMACLLLAVEDYEKGHK